MVGIPTYRPHLPKGYDTPCIQNESLGIHPHFKFLWNFSPSDVYGDADSVGELESSDSTIVLLSYREK